MKWNGAIFLLLAFVVTRSAIAQDFEGTESTTIAADVSNKKPSSADNSQIQLDTKLRTALLQALTDLENEESSEAAGADSSDDDGKIIEKAHASAITIYAKSDISPAIPSSKDESEDKNSKTSKTIEHTSKSEEDPSKQKAELVIFQRSHSLQAPPITSLETSPIDPLKDAERIITSASSSFITTDSQNAVRSVDDNFITTNSEPKSIQTNTKISSFANFNAISNSESKKPSKEKFSIGKPVDEPVIVKTYVKPLGPDEQLGVSYVKANEDGVGSTDSGEKTDGENAEGHTETPVEVSTEESEAKVEQVQFFSAPLVAAFTVHQDEKGQPKKVEPIYKNGLSSKEEKPTPVQQPSIPQPSQTLLQSSTFNTLNLQQKQQLLEQELEKLRSQQQNLLSRNNFISSQNFNNLDSKNQAFTQSGFTQAINQNFNQFDPVFTEPDRSIVTKLATIDPSNLLSQSGQFLNRFVPSEAILSLSPKIIQNQSKIKGDVSLVPSISYDPLVEAGKLPKNAQILPNKEPTGFHKYVKLSKPLNPQNFIQPSSSFIHPNQNGVQPNINLIQPSISNFISQNVKSNNFLDNQPNRFQDLSQNRFLRQEQGISNVGFNQNSFSIVPAQQPFPPKHELSFFPDNNRFLRQNEAVLSQPQQNFGGNQNFNIQNTRFFKGNLNNLQTGNGQNQNRVFRSNLEGTLISPQNVNIQQSIQPFGAQPLTSSSQNNRFFRSNQEGTFNSPQKFPQNTRILRSNQEGTFSVNQNGLLYTPVLQTYKYSNSFGFPSIPLH